MLVPTIRTSRLFLLCGTLLAFNACALKNEQPYSNYHPPASVPRGNNDLIESPPSERPEAPPTQNTQSVPAPGDLPRLGSDFRPTLEPLPPHIAHDTPPTVTTASIIGTWKVEQIWCDGVQPPENTHSFFEGANQMTFEFSASNSGYLKIASSPRVQDAACTSKVSFEFEVLDKEPPAYLILKPSESPVSSPPGCSNDAFMSKVRERGRGMNDWIRNSLGSRIFNPAWMAVRGISVYTLGLDPGPWGGPPMLENMILGGRQLGAGQELIAGYLPELMTFGVYENQEGSTRGPTLELKVRNYYGCRNAAKPYSPNHAIISLVRLN